MRYRKQPDWAMFAWADFRSAETRFFEKVEESTSTYGGTRCWDWTAATGCGYGAFYFARRVRRAHRWAYEFMRGEIGDLDLDHLCRRSVCVNPWHLEPVTVAENARRVFDLDSGFCRKGHDLSTEGVYTFPDGRRACRGCQRDSWTRGRTNRACA